MTLEHLKEKKAILFDLDGTLVDSMWMWKEIDIEYLGKFGLNCPEDLQKVIEGMSFSETAVYFKNRFQLEDSLEQIKQDWISMSLYKYKHEVPLKPGAGEFLQWAEYGYGNCNQQRERNGGRCAGVLKDFKVFQPGDNCLRSGGGKAGS